MQTSANNGDQLPQLFGDPDAKHVNLDETADEALAAVLAQLESSGSASVSIYRQGPGGYRDVTFLTECLPAEYSLSRLQDEYNGGTFRVHVREGGRLVANKEVKVAPRPGRPPQADAALAPLAQQVAALTSTVERLVQMQVQQQKPADNEDALLDRMIKYKQIFGGGPAVQQQDPFDAVTKLLALAKDVNKLTGNAPPEPPDGLTLLADTAKTVLPALVAVSNAQQRQVMQAPAPVSMRAPAPVVQENPLPPAMPQPQAQPQNQTDEANMLKMYVGLLIKDAERNVDPTGWAHMIVNNLAEDEIRSLLEPADWFEKLTQFEPKVTHFREWFSELREFIFELLTEDGAADTTGGNSSDGTNHASGGAANTNTQGHS